MRNVNYKKKCEFLMNIKEAVLAAENIEKAIEKKEFFRKAWIKKKKQ